MAVNTFEKFPDQFVRAELFRVAGGDYSGDTFTYTNFEHEIVWGEDTYEPIPIGHNGIRRGVRLESDQASVTIDPDCPLANFLIPDMPRRRITVEIMETAVRYDGLSNLATVSATPRVVWEGNISDIDLAKDAPVLNCRSSTSKLHRLGNRRRWQRGCWHTLYEGLCGALKASATTTVAASDQTSNVLTVASGWEGAAIREDYVRGRAEWVGPKGLSMREIIAVTETSITLDSAFLDFTGPQDVDVIYGCDRSYETCGRLHDAQQTFGGQRRIPKDNPLGSNSHI